MAPQDEEHALKPKTYFDLGAKCRVQDQVQADGLAQRLP